MKLHYWVRSRPAELGRRRGGRGAEVGAGAEGETRAAAEGAGGGEREGAAGAAEAGERNSGLLISIGGR